MTRENEFPSEMEFSGLLSEEGRRSPHTTMRRDAYNVAVRLFSKYRGCSPEEKREAEREAWDAAIDCVLLQDDCTRAVAERARDRQFPRLTPEPPTVTLSDGNQYRRLSGQWQCTDGEERGRPVWVGMVMPDSPRCVTYSDFTKCDALRKAQDDTK